MLCVLLGFFGIYKSIGGGIRINMAEFLANAHSSLLKTAKKVGGLKINNFEVMSDVKKKPTQMCSRDGEMGHILVKTTIFGWSHEGNFGHLQSKA